MIKITLPNTPQGYLDIFKTSFRISKYTFVKTFPLFVLVFVSSFAFLKIENWVRNYKEIDLKIIIGCMLLLGFFIICYASIGGVIYRMIGLIRQQDPGFILAFKAGFKKIIPLIVVSILYGLSMILGLVLLIIPGIIVSIYFVFSIFLIYENCGIIDSFIESYRIVKHHWWRTSINLCLGSLFVCFSVILVNVLMLFVLDLNDILMKQTYSLLSYFFEGFIICLAFILLMMVYNFSIAFMLNCIHDLRIRKQNYF